MVKLEDYKHIAQEFLQEACSRLGIADGMVRLVFVPSLSPIHGIPQFSEYNDAENTIFVSEDWLNSLIPQNGVTSLRSEIYAKARQAYQHTVKHLSHPDMDDAMAFSMALMGIKGVQAPSLPLPPAFARLETQLQDKTIEILKNEFGFDAEVKKETFQDGTKRTFIKLTDDAEKKLADIQTSVGYNDLGRHFYNEILMEPGLGHIVDFSDEKAFKQNNTFQVTTEMTCGSKKENKCN